MTNLVVILGNEAVLEDPDGIYHPASREDLVAEIERLQAKLAKGTARLVFMDGRVIEIPPGSDVKVTVTGGGGGGGSEPPDEPEPKT